MGAPNGIRVGTGTTVRRFDDYDAWLDTAEGVGFDLLTCGDSQSLWADCFSVMTYAAANTTRPELAITVSNPKTRHPAVTASAAASVQQISHGRFHYGVATGDSALRNIGVPPATVDELEAYVRAVQGLTAGRSIRWRDEELELRWLQDPVAVPVWIAAEGPRTQQLAGRIADGVILSNSLTPERMAIARHHLALGAAEAGRRIDDIDIWCMCNLVFAPSEAEGIESILSVLAGTAAHVFRFSLDDKGLPDELRDRIRGLMSEYQSAHHAQPGSANPNHGLIDKYGLRSYLAAQGTIAGPPEHCVARIREVADIGATNLIFSQFVSDPQEWMRRFAADILPSVR
jgi:alkanesulfonate monooxygenase SsuD/methylene tetrahydromethanopterin reductase-like flavin-dependent oxidoreductase (luciferase family)